MTAVVTGKPMMTGAATGAGVGRGKRNSKGTKPPVTGQTRAEYLANPNRGSYLPKTTIAEITSLRRSGLSYREIGERVRRSIDTVMRVCHFPEVEAELNRSADELLMAYRKRVMQIVPEALDALADLVKIRDRVAVTRLLLGTKTLVERTEQFVELKQAESDLPVEDQFYKAMHGHLPSEPCHCGEKDRPEPKAEPEPGKGKKV